MCYAEKGKQKELSMEFLERQGHMLLNLDLATRRTLGYVEQFQESGEKPHYCALRRK